MTKCFLLTFLAIDVIKKVDAIFHNAVADIAEVTANTQTHTHKLQKMQFAHHTATLQNAMSIAFNKNQS